MHMLGSYHTFCGTEKSVGNDVREAHPSPLLWHKFECVLSGGESAILSVVTRLTVTAGMNVHVLTTNHDLAVCRSRYPKNCLIAGWCSYGAVFRADCPAVDVFFQAFHISYWISCRAPALGVSCCSEC